MQHKWGNEKCKQKYGLTTAWEEIVR